MCFILDPFAALWMYPSHLLRRQSLLCVLCHQIESRGKVALKNSSRCLTAQFLCKEAILSICEL